MMARVVVQGIWQQKHPTPGHPAWEFHFHPAGAPPEVTSALAALDLALAGGGQGVVITPRWLAWVRAFTAEVPSEQRGYVGLAGVLATGADLAPVLPALLLRLELPPAAPFEAELDPRPLELAPVAPAPVELGDHEAALAWARLVVGGGRADLPGEPALLGRLLAWLPGELAARERSLVFTAGARPQSGEVDENLCHYLARAWNHPDGLATWRALGASRRPLASRFATLAELSTAWDSAEGLARYLRGVLTDEEIARCDAAAPAPLLAPGGDAGTLWNRVLHYWGRGFLPGAEERLARVLAARVLVDHLVRLDGGADDLPLRYVRRLRYEALLPAPRARVLVDALRRELVA
jgi:hypothetical protein